MSDVRYRLMQPADAEAVSSLVLASFEEYIAPEYTPVGVEAFRKFAGAEALRERAGADHFVIVATTSHCVVGMIEFRHSDHVSLLFVDKATHRKGVARALLEHGLAEARAREPGVERVTVNSTRFGVPAYDKLGFLQTGPERAVNGIVFIPMAMRLDTAATGSGTGA